MSPPGKRNGPPAQRPAPKDIDLDADTTKHAPGVLPSQLTHAHDVDEMTLRDPADRGPQLFKFGRFRKPRPLAVFPWRSAATRAGR